MPNDERYAVLETVGELGGIFYMRQSGSKVYSYSPYEEQERLRYDFSKSLGDTVIVNYGEYDTTIVTVTCDSWVDIFGKSRRRWCYRRESISSTLWSYTEVVDSIGLTYATWEVSPYDIYLNGAIIDGITYGSLGTTEGPLSIPQEYLFGKVYPNPFNPMTTIEFSMPQGGLVTLTAYDLLGREVATILNQLMSPGRHKVQWDASHIPSGIYFVRMEAGPITQTQKVTVLR